MYICTFCRWDRAFTFFLYTSFPNAILWRLACIKRKLRCGVCVSRSSSSSSGILCTTREESVYTIYIATVVVAFLLQGLGAEAMLRTWLATGALVHFGRWCRRSCMRRSRCTARCTQGHRARPHCRCSSHDWWVVSTILWLLLLFFFFFMQWKLERHYRKQIISLMWNI